MYSVKELSTMHQNSNKFCKINDVKMSLIHRIVSTTRREIPDFNILNNRNNKKKYIKVKYTMYVCFVHTWFYIFDKNSISKYAFEFVNFTKCFEL